MEPWIITKKSPGCSIKTSVLHFEKELHKLLLPYTADDHTEGSNHKQGDGNQHLPQLAINKSADSDHLHPGGFKELAKKALEPVQKSLNPREVLEDQEKMNVLSVF